VQGKAYTFQGTIAAKMQRYKQIEKLDEEAEQEESELVSLGLRVEGLGEARQRGEGKRSRSW
jgi:hypothetical protein